MHYFGPANFVQQNDHRTTQFDKNRSKSSCCAGVHFVYYNAEVHLGCFSDFMFHLEYTKRRAGALQGETSAFGRLQHANGNAKELKSLRRGFKDLNIRVNLLTLKTAQVKRSFHFFQHVERLQGKRQQWGKPHTSAGRSKIDVSVELVFHTKHTAAAPGPAAGKLRDGTVKFMCRNSFVRQLNTTSPTEQPLYRHSSLPQLKATR